jgi:hypothetical protein
MTDDPRREAVARALYEARAYRGLWESAHPDTAAEYRAMADAALAAADAAAPALPDDVAGLVERMRAEEARMQTLFDFIETQRYKHQGAAFTDINQIKHGLAGRDPVLEPAIAALERQAREIERLKLEARDHWFASLSAEGRAETAEAALAKAEAALQAIDCAFDFPFMRLDEEQRAAVMLIPAALAEIAALKAQPVRDNPACFPTSRADETQRLEAALAPVVTDDMVERALKVYRENDSTDDFDDMRAALTAALTTPQETTDDNAA